MNICNDIYELIQDNLNSILGLRDRRTLKADGSYVTEGDLLAEKIAIDYINSSDEGFEIISEETPNKEFVYDENKNYFIIDPIDGTENFTSGLREWGVSICIYKKGKHFQSMLALPELNEKIITGDKVRFFKSRIYGLSSSLTKKDMVNLPDGYEYRIMGCSVYNIMNAIKGSYIVFENIKGAMVWDIIAGLNIALENGLRVTVNKNKYNGEFLQPDKKYRFKIQQ